MIRFPGWAAPWLVAGVLATLVLKSAVSTASWSMLALMGFGSAAVGFAVGIPFWIRDRRRQ
jgi:hypothetical protein